MLKEHAAGLSAGELCRKYGISDATLSLPKISSGLDSLVGKNHCIIGYDACDPPFAREVRRRHIQVATQAGSREPVSPSSAQHRIEASGASSAAARR